jgi:hypothetical protein
MTAGSDTGTSQLPCRRWQQLGDHGGWWFQNHLPAVPAPRGRATSGFTWPASQLNEDFSR